MSICDGCTFGEHRIVILLDACTQPDARIQADVLNEFLTAVRLGETPSVEPLKTLAIRDITEQYADECGQDERDCQREAEIMAADLREDMRLDR